MQVCLALELAVCLFLGLVCVCVWLSFRLLAIGRGCREAHPLSSVIVPTLVALNDQAECGPSLMYSCLCMRVQVDRHAKLISNKCELLLWSSWRRRETTDGGAT